MCALSLSPKDILAQFDDLAMARNGNRPLSTEKQLESLLNGLWSLTVWCDTYLIAPIEEPQLFQDIKRGIIRAFEITTTSADGNEQIVTAIEDTIESLRYAIACSDPAPGNHFDQTEVEADRRSTTRTLSTQR